MPVIHAAGVLDDGALAEQTLERGARVLAPKVAGAWNLHHLTRHADLDFFVCFSSASGTLGWRGQAMYAAANTFMDALMEHRAASGMHGLSIAWGPWARVGMAARSDASEIAVRRARGVRPIAPESALLALERLLVQGPAHVLCVSADWNAFARSWHAKRMPDYLRALVLNDPNASLGAVEAELGVGKEPGALRAVLEQTPVNQRLAVLSRYVRALLARTLRFSSSDQIDPRQGFFDMGVDSLSAVERAKEDGLGSVAIHSGALGRGRPWRCWLQ
jgi:KR domain/Phosphopantetheine attachment site